MDKPKPADYEWSCEVCFVPIAPGQDVCAACARRDQEREEYVESMIDAGRGHLLR